jgi:hypothetical protein
MDEAVMQDIGPPCPFMQQDPSQEEVEEKKKTGKKKRNTLTRDIDCLTDWLLIGLSLHRSVWRTREISHTCQMLLRAGGGA